MITDQSWDEVNTLLSYMRSYGFNLVELVDKHFLQYGNTAPGILLQKQIEVVQGHLDASRSKEQT